MLYFGNLTVKHWWYFSLPIFFFFPAQVICRYSKAPVSSGLAWHLFHEKVVVKSSQKSLTSLHASTDKEGRLHICPSIPFNLFSHSQYFLSKWVTVCCYWSSPGRGLYRPATTNKHVLEQGRWPYEALVGALLFTAQGFPLIHGPLDLLQPAYTEIILQDEQLCLAWPGGSQSMREAKKLWCKCVGAEPSQGTSSSGQSCESHVSMGDSIVIFTWGLRRCMLIMLAFRKWRGKFHLRYFFFRVWL